MAKPPKSNMLAFFEHLKPPPGFAKKDYLGAGAWKVAFRASSPASLVDVALLCYHGDNTKAIAEDVSKLVRLVSKDDYARYITRVHNIHFDDDQRVWIAEELLTESLSSLSPLEETRTFCEIARDLCRALSFIHSKGLVHRDMKLDNCGIDVDAQIAKIFDVGSVTSEFSGEVCTILTRAPEFLRSEAAGRPLQFTKGGDIWGLGATLFALRTGEYPFVDGKEAAERASLGELLATRQINQQEYQDRKAGLDADIRRRVADRNAEADLLAKIDAVWTEGARRVMREMLRFGNAARESADYFQRQWTLLADDFMTPASTDEPVTPQKAICDFLKSVEAGHMVATLAQVEKCGRRLDRYRKGMSQREHQSAIKLVTRTKRKVESYWRDQRPSAT